MSGLATRRRGWRVSTGARPRPSIRERPTPSSGWLRRSWPRCRRSSTWPLRGGCPACGPTVARRLTAEVSLSNAAFALASGVPSLVPILGIPISAADTIVLTKNQALMVYRLALAYGAPPEFQRRMMEITPVIGAAVVWRQVAGGLVGLVPGYGILPKTAVAYAGTYITGRAADSGTRPASSPGPTCGASGQRRRRRPARWRIR